jgi:hypothetical protein
MACSYDVVIPTTTGSFGQSRLGPLALHLISYLLVVSLPWNGSLKGMFGRSQSFATQRTW